jgi:YVTN family beta-propeller protein
MGRVRVGGGPASLAFADGALWVANSLDSTVSRVDPVTRAATATIPVGSGPSSIAAAGGSVWVASRYSREVARVDPRDNRVTMAVKVGGLATSLSSDRGRLWVGVAADSTSHRGGTLTIVTRLDSSSESRLDSQSPDPAFYDLAFAPQFMGLAYDTLVTFQHTDGAAGSRLVPDLAVSLSRATADGRTYAFRIRPHVRYSDGRVVQASDFRRAIERLFRLHSPGAPFFSGLMGAARCERTAAACDLSRGVVSDDARGTVAFHLVRRDPDFLFRLTAQAYSAPIPRGTPDREPHGRTVPGTGPYTIVKADREQVRFVRNRYFREWAHAAQPAGSPDEIVWRSLPSADAAVAAVQRSEADWFYGTIPARRYRSLALNHPGALHISPTFGIEFVPLNTHIAPFNDVRVRRALNYAVDRRHIAELYGGSAFAAPTCQPLAPGMPGYRRYCPYTRRPTSGGAWSAADVARARRLVAASGTRGETIDVWGAPDEGFVPPSVPHYIASVLRGLGYRVRLHMVPFASISEAMRRHFQLSVDGDWVAEYPVPSAYLPQFFGCRGGTSNGYVCRPGLDRQMTRAAELGPRKPASSNALWTRIDHRLTDLAAWVPTVAEREVEVTSARLHNYEYNPVWGFLADQSWLR